jgi:HEAT repeat protein
LLETIESERHEDALEAIIIALGRTKDFRAIDQLLPFANHGSAVVRLAVAFGLLTVERPDPVEALIELSKDEDPDVRNWATFGLGSLIEIDSQSIRNSLLGRLQEADQEIRGEALVGLALRKDERVLALLLTELRSESVGILAVEAAAELANERLCASLRNLQTWWDVDKDLLASALEACCKS